MDFLVLTNLGDKLNECAVSLGGFNQRMTALVKELDVFMDL